MKTHIIQLDSHDDVLSVRDKMAWSKAPRILLVWPQRGSVLKRQVDLFLLHRHARSLGAQLGLVTQDQDVRRIALEEGIPVFGSVVQAQNRSWRRPRRQRRRNWLNQRPRVVPTDLRTWRSSLRPKQMDYPFLRILSFVLGILAVFSLVAFFLPSAKVVLTPLQIEQKLDLPVWASPDLPSVNLSGGLPAFPVSVVVEGGEQSPSTGKTALPDRSATGEVVLSNLGVQPVEIPQGTVILGGAEGSNRYETTRQVIVPGGVGQTVTVPVRALLPGSQGNLDAGSTLAVEGLLGMVVLANNPEPIQGGEDRWSPSPAEQDYQKLEQTLENSLRSAAMEELLKSLTSDQLLVPGSLKLSKKMSETREPQPGQPGSEARLNLQAEFTAWYIRKADLSSLSQTALNVSLPAGFHPLPESLEFHFAEGSKIDAQGAIHWTTQVYRKAEADWSGGVAAQALVGYPSTEAVSRLMAMFSLAEPPEVYLFPSWWPRMPWVPFRIEVVKR
ncbi:MAG TPA: hypothetical protein DEQ80_09740 [Anaerolinea thermolimosa]|uniref:Baseplate protein J-like barrel domain-containing protein n=1 Tax=Anaerolinea thermolimosa TaxID=229919 RepID=A0A3D1JIS0_9CHLR|nr:baseplate J/gp47 family protein [Anaerolinea thermolimosa]GAP07025.1 baseplate J-like protein [Anaerolinea thermolimosa]HCE18127.1 hypothetical protein [Anaerolinea thermolimosa]